MELHLVSIWDPAEPIPGLTSATTDASVGELDRYLKATTKNVQRDGVAVTSEACTGDTVTEIKRIAKERDGSMVMLCSHGHGGYREAYIGSIADRLVRFVGVPVLVIPATP